MPRNPDASSSRATSETTPHTGPVRQLLTPTWPTLLLMGAGVFLAVMMALGIRNERGFLTMWRVQRNITRLSQEVRMIEQGNRSLLHDIERLHDDMRYIEKIAREELGLARPGELVFEFVD